MPTEAVRLVIHGVVQGVGFRPFVYRTAAACGLTGFVTNTPGSVVVHVEGEPGAVARFCRLLRADAPAAARVTGIGKTRVAAAGHEAFAILASERKGIALSTIPPDIATCPACARELSDPSDRRHRYPFINCTNCGPRFTIVRKLPYDRESTSMARFTLCPACRKEYEDPGDRRFHAEPNACPVCGPKLRIVRKGKPVVAADPVRAAAGALRNGEIVALRGLGGFQLAADAANGGALRTLRERKQREEKPFAVMVEDLPAARSLAKVGAADAAALSSPCAPIVLLDLRKGAPISPEVAPGLSRVGLFLPYTPLHRLLLAEAGRPLVMTSGNLTDEPIAIGNEEALGRLEGIADLFLLHDREIVQRSDDSVVRTVGGRIYPIRRARGFVPAPITIRHPKKGGVPAGEKKFLSAGRNVPDYCVAGLGGELKNTFCVIKKNVAYLSQHLGDLDNVPVRDFYAETLDFFRTFLDVEFSAVCRDLHPAYFTTAFAERVPARRILSLQHHKAHLYSLLAETGFSGKAVGVAFDGTGYGEDGTIWGGEFFHVDGARMRRAASLDSFPLQGGDSAVKEPWKAALGLLRETYGAEESARVALSLFPGIDPARMHILLDAIGKKVNVVPTSSCGRLFDAVSAIAGVCRKASYEGQAAMLLEGALRGGNGAGTYPFRLERRGELLGVNWKEMVAGVVDDIRGGVAAPVVARRFHDTVGAVVLRVCATLAEETDARHVLLSGGVFQNVHLLRTLLAGFRQRKMKTLIHREVPANDGGISLGQAFYALITIAGG